MKSYKFIALGTVQGKNIKGSSLAKPNMKKQKAAKLQNKTKPNS
jgi:hypothetical protein